MKQMNLHRFGFLAVLVFGVFSTATVRAQIAAQDHAANTAYTNSWGQGTNGGFGFGPWNLLQNNQPASNNYAGFYLGNSGVGAVDVTNKSFGLYANGTDYNFAIAHRAFSNALTTSQVFTFKFKNNGIALGKVVGFSLFNGTASPPTDSLASLTLAARFSFYFVGGNNNYTLYDGDGSFITDVPYHGDGLTLEFALRTADTYHFSVKSADGAAIYSSYDDFSLRGSGTIDSFACYTLDNDGGGDLFVNQFQVAATSLVPPVILNVQPTNGSFFLPTTTAITFNAATTFSTISANTNKIRVALNGTNVTSFGYSGSATNWSVTASPVLTANQTYATVITVTDDNGNSVTNTFSFNTWSATNIYVEAEAYNYAGGGAILSPFAGQYDAQAGITSVSNIDFFEYADAGTNPYRSNDAVDFEISGDSNDHADYLNLGLTNWSLDYVQSGEWLNYTRSLKTNTAYNVYARLSGGAVPQMLLERAAATTATTTNQPRAALGRFVGTDTGNIISNYAFAPLKDFFGNNVAVRFTVTNHTFRVTRVGDSCNFDYFTFVPVVSAATLRPYLSAGFPTPNATGILPDQRISFTLANRQTTNVTASTKLFVNGADVSGSLAFTNHAAGTTVSYTPAALYPLNATNTLRAVFTDNGGVTQTNDWTFTTANILVLSNNFALPTASGVSNGFNLHVVKFPDVWPGNAAPAPLSSAWAEAMLAGTTLNTNTSSPYAPDVNLFTAETNTLNYELCGRVSPDGSTFTNSGAVFPGVPVNSYAPCANTNGPGNFALAAVMYVQLPAGLHQWAVRSDDGFRLTTGTNTANPTDFKIMDYEGGRGAQTPSEFYFIAPVTGVYPMRLLYYQGGFGGSVQFYSLDRATGTPALINDPANGNSIKTYRTSSALVTGVNLLNPAHTASTTTFNFLTQAGKTHTVQYKNALSDAVWQTLLIVTGNGANTNLTDNTATGTKRFYRVATQ